MFKFLDLNILALHANQYADNVIQLPPLSMFARGDCQHKDESGNQSGVDHTIPIQPPPPQHHHLSCTTIGASVSMLFLLVKLTWGLPFLIA